MSAEVGSMFYVREMPWHGLGTNVEKALSSEEALAAAGLGWDVVQKKIYTEDWNSVPGFYANVRDSDNKVLGVVSHRYRIVQNREAFAFTDGLLGKGVRYETAGSLRGGRKTWILARLPKQYRLADDRVMPYLVFSNSHDGSGSIKAAMTPIRVACNNTLNLALQGADRIWTASHTGDMGGEAGGCEKDAVYGRKLYGWAFQRNGKALQEENQQRGSGGIYQNPPAGCIGRNRGNGSKCHASEG